MDDLNILGVIKIYVEFFSLVFEFLFTILWRGGRLLLIIIVLDDVGETLDTSSLLVSVQNAYFLGHCIPFRIFTKNYAKLLILVIEFVKTGKNLSLRHVFKLRKQFFVIGC